MFQREKKTIPLCWIPKGFKLFIFSRVINPPPPTTHPNHTPQLQIHKKSVTRLYKLLSIEDQKG